MKSKSYLHYDSANMLQKAVGGALEKRLEKARKTIIDRADSGEQGWLSLPDDRVMVKRIQDLVAKKKKFEHCLVIGIGGSDLGARALYKALGAPPASFLSSRASPRAEGPLRRDPSALVGMTEAMQLWFAGANTDPDELEALLRQIPWEKTLVNIISKSGDTLEPMATFFAVHEKLMAEQIVATTDAQRGSLRGLSDREGYVTLPVVGNVGGRFSVLSDVGLFPLACAGINIEEVLRGAKQERDAFLSQSIQSSSIMQFAASQYQALKKGQHIHVLMPYAERLREFGFWYRQLWAESLGKEGIGPTPIASLGATDQHSQIQLYHDGPKDKTVTFIEVDQFESRLRVSSALKEIPPLAYASGKTFQELIHAERAATAYALTKAGRPNGTIHVSSLTPATMGRLVMFFELATAVMGELMGINPYDQPGVEEGKREIKRILTK